MSLNKAFREIARVNTSRSAFDLSHYNLSTHNMGLLYPVLCKFTMPGDKWVIDIKSVIRAMPLNYPAYVDIDVNYHCFFVASRLLDDDFESFVTGGEKGDFTKLIPKIGDVSPYPDGSGNLSAVTHFKSAHDHIVKRLGLVPYNQTDFNIQDIPVDLRPTSLPLRAYYFIWNEYYRDQNLQSKILFKTLNREINDISNFEKFFEDSSKAPSITEHFLRVAWLKDYFTSSLPFQQRGTAPIIPFNGDIELNSDVTPEQVINLGTSASFYALTPGSKRYLGTDRNAWASGNVVSFPDYVAGNKLVLTSASTPEGAMNLSVSSQTLAENFLKNIHANVFDGLSVKDLRVAVQLQKFFERNARAGVRYTEFLDSHYNVSPTDARLDRPEFIGGCKFPVVVSDVISTAVTTDNKGQVISDLGSYAGKMVSGITEDTVVNYFVEEFGYIMILFFIRPKTLYFQGFNREFQYSSPLEYPFPEFMHLSEQGITNSEIYVASSSNTFDPSGIFGYQGIFDELRYSKSVISGQMALPAQSDSYFPWHLARVFDDKSLPRLNNTFVECKPRSDIFQVTDTDSTTGTNEFIIQHKFDIKCVRPMPIIGEPGLVDHF